MTMLKNLIDDKRLDLDAPLLSVRRFEPESGLKQAATAAAGGGNPKNPYPKRSALPFYKSDLKSGPIRNPGVVPFIWEHSPGQPKHGARLDRPSVSPKLPPGRILIDKESANLSTAAVDEKKLMEAEDEKRRPSISAECNEEKEDNEEEEKYSNALETLSSTTESFFMNCSVSRLSETQGRADASGSFLTDPQVRDFMMGRFLLAAKEVATGSLHASSKKPPVQAQEPTRVSRAMQHGSLGHAEEECSWEAVYKHKLMHGNPQWEDVSKLANESINLSYWSDSLTADESSLQRRSNIGGISFHRNEPSQSPFQEGKSFLGGRRDRKGSKTDGSDSFEKAERYWVVTPHHSSMCDSGSASPTAERALYVDAAHIPAIPLSKSSSLVASSDNKDITRLNDEDSEVGVQSQRMDGSPVLETCDRDALLAEVTNIVETGSTVQEETSACGAMNENNCFKPCDNDDSPLLLKEENEVKKVADHMPSLLSPPLPNSPSESWLSRTLPSVSSKNPSSLSFLGIHFQPMKQASNSSLTLLKKEIPVKALKVQHGQTRLADMLAKPLSPQSDI